MKLNDSIEIHAGGVGSGCNPRVGKCGRKKGPVKVTKQNYSKLEISDDEDKYIAEWNKTYPEEDFEPFDSNLGSVAVVRAKGKLAAGAGFMIEEGTLWIAEMRSHFKGAGKDLLSKLQNYAKTKKLKSIEFETELYNVETLAKSLGFRKGPEGAVGHVYKWKVK